MNVRMHRARSGPSGVFKARSVAPSRGMRQSIITVLHIDTTVGHRAARRRTARVEPETAAKRERKRGRERESERERERERRRRRRRKRKHWGTPHARQGARVSA